MSDEFADVVQQQKLRVSLEDDYPDCSDLPSNIEKQPVATANATHLESDTAIPVEVFTDLFYRDEQMRWFRRTFFMQAQFAVGSWFVALISWYACRGAVSDQLSLLTGIALWLGTFSMALLLALSKSERLADEVVFDPRSKLVIVPTTVYHELDASRSHRGSYETALVILHLVLLLTSLFSPVNVALLLLAYSLIYAKLVFELRRVKRRLKQASMPDFPVVWRLG